GGEALTKNDKDKIHGADLMLTLDDSGNLVIRGEMKDAKEWMAETKAPERPNGFVGPRGIQSPEGRPRGGREQVRPAPRGGGGLSASPDSCLPYTAPAR